MSLNFSNAPNGHKRVNFKSGLFDRGGNILIYSAKRQNVYLISGRRFHVMD